MTILLGTYGKSATPFYLYVHRSKTYLSLQDINFIYFNQQLDTKLKLITDCNSTDFIREKTTGNILLNTRKIIRIARYFNCYSLAELCKLSIDQVLGNVAQPLLNIIRCDQWRPLSVTVVERDLQFEALDDDEWPLIAPHVAAKQSMPFIKLPQASTKDSIYKWLSFNLFENCSSPETIQALLITAKTRKQQRAIIETRQRKAGFIPRKRQSAPMKRLKTPNVKRLKPSPTFDNLALLATQATQLRGLSSPPTHQHRLPSLQTLLSDLKNHPF